MIRRPNLPREQHLHPRLRSRRGCSAACCCSLSARWFGISYPDATSKSSKPQNHRSKRPRPRQAKRLTQACSPKLKGIKAGDTDVGELATSAVNHLYSSLVGVKDEASAQASLPSLNQASSEFDQLAGLLSQLSPENRKLLAETFASIRPNLDQLLDKALAIPGVAVIIKPAVDAIRSKLDALSAA